MYPDPVVDEVRQNGARIAEECGGDVHRMAERFRREQAEHPDRVVHRPHRRGDRKAQD
jgi:hypothetical protein